MRRILLALTGLAAAVPLTAFAHAFGQQYTLPIPIELYMLGGGAVLVLSFLVLAFVPRAQRAEETPGRLILGAQASKTLVALVRGLLLLCVGLAIVVGIFGSTESTANFAPYAFWIYFLLGFAYLSVLVRGLWDAATPLTLPLPGIRHDSVERTYPTWAAHVPALILYVALLWLELMSGGAGSVPQTIAFGLLAYYLVSWIVIDRWGEAAWREHFDVFGLFFRTLGFMAPLSVTPEGIRLGVSAKRLSTQSAGSLALVLFIISVLAFTAFDGFSETLPFIQMGLWLHTFLPSAVVQALAFLAMPLLFVALYALCILGVRVMTHGVPYRDLLKAYAFSLIPIAVVYHFAHYFTLLLVEGQRIIALVSDPLGQGWNLFGTADFSPNPGIIGADVVWHVQVAVIVLGHVLALYLSHLVTNRLVPERWRAVAAEIPLLTVMVFYTAFGLWILSQPFAL